MNCLLCHKDIPLTAQSYCKVYFCISCQFIMFDDPENYFYYIKILQSPIPITSWDNWVQNLVYCSYIKWDEKKPPSCKYYSKEGERIFLPWLSFDITWNRLQKLLVFL